jgi:hypothetical protein
LTPHVEKYFAQQILGECLAADEAQELAIDGRPMPREQGVHGELVASGDAVNQDDIRRGFPAPAAIADTAAAAEFGPFNASSMENSPLTHVPTYKAASGGAVPAFFS